MYFRTTSGPTYVAAELVAPERRVLPWKLSGLFNSHFPLTNVSSLSQ